MLKALFGESNQGAIAAAEIENNKDSILSTII